MIQEVANKIWANPRFHEIAAAIELAWLGRELGVECPTELTPQLAGRAMSAAASLACSSDDEHRRAAFKVATCGFELFGCEQVPLDQGLRVVLTRLGNFPSIDTKAPVREAINALPWSLAAEELSAAEGRTISIHGHSFQLTDFQLTLWKRLNEKKKIALAAPTSAGKSFVLQSYLSSLFGSDHPLSVVYIVPTRALIAQVATDLAEHFSEKKTHVPELITIPVDSETELPPRGIYVMTQERVQLAMGAHSRFAADVIIVDEAQSIADGARGILLQWVIDDLLSRNSEAQILFASPTIRNLNVFSRLFDLADVTELLSREPTVAQNFLLVNIETATKGKLAIQTVGDGKLEPRDVVRLTLNQTTASRIDKLVHIPAALGRGQSNIVYANGAAEAEDIALQLADLFSEREPTAAQLALAELAEESVHGQYVLSQCVKKGIAFHYSNIPTLLRRAVELATAAGDIDYLVCTSTLLQGVNLPARNIFMCAPEKGRQRPLESTDFWNLAGRAGRLRREFQGNIFLIDYNSWKKKPLDGPRDSVVTPAIESAIRDRQSELVNVISGEGDTRAQRDTPDLESVFVRLLSDLKKGDLSATLERAGFAADAPHSTTMTTALGDAESKITLPAEIIRRTPNISAHKQQRMFNHLKQRIDDGGREAAKALIPRHPREDSFQSYADILELCHRIVLGIDTSKGLHRFHALIAQRWMRGWPLPRIIDQQLERPKAPKPRTSIRNTLTLIENEIRFQAVRLFGCYNAVLVHALNEAELHDLEAGIPALPLYLELGASDKTMISFVSMGLSRVAATKLNEASARKDLDPAAAKQWLRSQNLESLGLSPLLLGEVIRLLVTV